LEKVEEKKLVRKIQNQLGRELKELGFSHTKPTFFVRQTHRPWYEIIHLHKFSYASSFRVHIALRHEYDNFDAIALNGPNSEGYKNYYLDFSVDEYSQNNCVSEILKFVKEIGFEWLENNQKQNFQRTLRNLKINIQQKDENIILTRNLLGLNK